MPWHKVESKNRFLKMFVIPRVCGTSPGGVVRGTLPRFANDGSSICWFEPRSSSNLCRVEVYCGLPLKQFLSKF
jgi:hypothetical protein